MPDLKASKITLHLFDWRASGQLFKDAGLPYEHRQVIEEENFEGVLRIAGACFAKKLNVMIFRNSIGETVLAVDTFRFEQR